MLVLQSAPCRDSWTLGLPLLLEKLHANIKKPSPLEGSTGKATFSDCMRVGQATQLGKAKAGPFLGLFTCTIQNAQL